MLKGFWIVNMSCVLYILYSNVSQIRRYEQWRIWKVFRSYRYAWSCFSNKKLFDENYASSAMILLLVYSIDEKDVFADLGNFPIKQEIELPHVLSI